MSAAEKVVAISFAVGLTELERCPLARRYRWHAPIEDWAKRRVEPVRDSDEHLYARPVLRERKRTPDDEVREMIRRQEAEAQAARIVQTETERFGRGPNSVDPADRQEILADERAQIHPQQQKEERAEPSPTSLLQETTAGERDAAEPSRTEAPPSFSAAPRRGRGGHFNYAAHQKVSAMISVSPELKSWLEKHKKFGETLDDTIRRLAHLRARTPI